MQKKHFKDQVRINADVKGELGRINSALSELVQEKGKFSSQPQPNPKSQNTKGVNAITT